ncbi:MAG: hydroxymethylbilane synthase [Oscillospiraceae bacterium]|nr:hydroxymethylbilane synthase [Oscillospiraceae bacterium]
MKEFRIGSRESRLAIVQAELLQAYLKETCPALPVRLVTMKTTGDRILDRPLETVGGKGLFVKELDLALLEGRTDCSVHSLKDLPMEVSAAIPVLGFSRREDPRDALVLPAGQTVWNRDLPLGCASRRRAIQIRRLCPGLRVELIRGNVPTRLQKLDEGRYGAIVLAAAGLRRLGLERRISRLFSPEEMLPAAGQGILAVQGRAGEDYACLAGFFDAEATACALAERAFVRALDGGCSSPIAAHAVLHAGVLTLTGLNCREGDDYWTNRISGDPAEAEALGATLARRMKAEE